MSLMSTTIKRVIVSFGKNLPKKSLNFRVLEVEITFLVKQLKGEVHVACKKIQQMLQEKKAIPLQ